MAVLVNFSLLQHQQLKYRLIVARFKVKCIEKTIRYCINHGLNKNSHFLLQYLDRCCDEFEVIYALTIDKK